MRIQTANKLPFKTEFRFICSSQRWVLTVIAKESFTPSEPLYIAMQWIPHYRFVLFLGNLRHGTPTVSLLDRNTACHQDGGVTAVPTFSFCTLPIANLKNALRRRHYVFPHIYHPCLVSRQVPTGSPSRGEDVAIWVFNINQPSLPTSFYSVLVSVSVFMTLSTVFHSINSLDNSPLSHSVLLVLFLPYWSFQLSPSALV